MQHATGIKNHSTILRKRLDTTLDQNLKHVKSKTALLRYQQVLQAQLNPLKIYQKQKWLKDRGIKHVTNKFTIHVSLHLWAWPLSSRDC